MYIVLVILPVFTHLHLATEIKEEPITPQGDSCIIKDWEIAEVPVSLLDKIVFGLSH